jgi:23S rRNA pseudouridine1911/1915/1917 synthase
MRQSSIKLFGIRQISGQLMKKLPGRKHSAGKREPRHPHLTRGLAIAYEDEAVAAVYKTAGLPAVPVKGSDAPSALSLLAAELKGRRQRALVVHRIDRYTSGILLFAKTERDREALVRQFLAHTPVREYMAVVRGYVRPEEGTLVHYLRRDGMFQMLSVEGDRRAARAELRYVVEQRLRGASLVRIRLVTGLQNQIRVQFSAIGHPVIGDRKYQPAEAAERRIARVALHAGHLEFVHPRSRERISVDCELPGDFRSLVRALSPR